MRSKEKRISKTKHISKAKIANKKTISPKEVSSIKEIMDKNKLVKDYSIKLNESKDYHIIDVLYKKGSIDFGSGTHDSGIEDFTIIFNIDYSKGYYDLIAYRSYHFIFNHRFDRLYRKKVKKFSTVLKNIEKTTDFS